MQKIEIVTLVDITRSRASRSETDRIKIGQQANFNSLVQAIGLRSNIDWREDPKQSDGRLPDPLEGSCVYWQWQFDIERDFVFQKDQDPVGHLADDVHGVPIITGLFETSDIHPAVFSAQGKNQNIWIKII
jgi:hypothetical protein